MPCPEKFKESLIEFGIDSDIIALINKDNDDLVSSSPKAKKAAYFKRAMDILQNSFLLEKRWCFHFQLVTSHT